MREIKVKSKLTLIRPTIYPQRGADIVTLSKQVQIIMQILRMILFVY